MKPKLTSISIHNLVISTKHIFTYANKFVYAVYNKKYIINILFFMYHLKRTLSFIESLTFNLGYTFFYNPNHYQNTYFFKYLYVLFEFINGFCTNYSIVNRRLKIKIPDAFIVYNFNKDYGILNEVHRFNIPLIGLYNYLDRFVYGLDYIIPFGILDEKGVKFFFNILLQTILFGYKKRLITIFKKFKEYNNLFLNPNSNASIFDKIYKNKIINNYDSNDELYDNIYFKTEYPKIYKSNYNFSFNNKVLLNKSLFLLKNLRRNFFERKTTFYFNKKLYLTKDQQKLHPLNYYFVSKKVGETLRNRFVSMLQRKRGYKRPMHLFKLYNNYKRYLTINNYQNSIINFDNNIYINKNTKLVEKLINKMRNIKNIKRIQLTFLQSKINSRKKKKKIEKLQLKKLKLVKSLKLKNLQKNKFKKLKRNGRKILNLKQNKIC